MGLKLAGKTGSTGRGVVYSVSSGMASIAAGIALLPLIIGTVGAGPYGAWLFVIAISSYFNYTDLGVGTAIVHFGSQKRGGSAKFSMSELLSAGLLWTTAIGLIVVPIYWYLSWSYLTGISPGVGISAEEIVTLAVMSTVIVGGLLIRPFSAVLVGSGYLLLDRKLQFVGVLVRVSGTLLACWLFRSISAIAIAEALALITPALLAAVVVWRKRLASVRLRWRIVSTLKRMMSFSTRAFAVSISSAMIANGGTLIIGIVGSPVQVTYFAAATRVLTGVGQITGWASIPFQPTLSRLFHAAPRRARKMVRSLIFSSFSVSAISCGLIISVAYPAVEVWLGGNVNHIEVANTIILLLAGAILNSLQRPVLLAAEAAGKPGLFFWTQSSIAAMFWALAFILGPQYGAVGIAVARLIPIVLVCPFYIAISGKHFGLGFESWWRSSVFPAFKFLIPAATLAFCTRFLPQVSGFLEWTPAVVFGLACCLFVFLFRSKLPLEAIRATLRSSM